MKRYRLSGYLHVLRIDDQHAAVAHGLLLERSVVANDLLECLDLFRAHALTAAEFRKRVPLAPKAADALFNTLTRLRYIVPSHVDEAELIRGTLLKKRVDRAWNQESANRYSTVSPLSIQSFASRTIPGGGASRPLRILLLGGCLIDLASDILLSIGPARGFLPEVRQGWVTGVPRIDEFDPHLVVYQFGVNGYLGPIWDHAPFLDDAELRSRVDQLKDRVALDVEAIRRMAGQSLLLVQGVSGPQIPPGGRTEFRRDLDFPSIVFELNDHARRLIQHDANALFVDEERLFARAGKRLMLDDLLSEYSHHGPLDYADYESWAPSPTRAELYGLDAGLPSVRILAQEYLDCYVLWAGIGRLKCVIVDLDDTLWQGVAADGRPTCFEMFRGLHQALKILKQRGVLLVTCSRNDEGVVMSCWRTLVLENRDLLSPDDFVMHKINWAPKSQNVLDIAHELELAPETILFIDDSPVERQEICEALPGVRVLGATMHLVRADLLGDPCLETSVASPESRRRSALVQQQLRREAEQTQAPDRSAFLRGLQIRIAVVRERDDQHVERLSELFVRTTQFNITACRLDVEGLRRFMRQDDAALYSARVSDRFVDYGVVAVCLVAHHAIEAFAMSCRVLALEVAVPFLSAALGDLGRSRMSGRITTTERNRPCWRLFSDAGFEQQPDGTYLLADLSRLAPVDDRVYAVELVRT